MSAPTIAQQKKLIKKIKTPERFFKIDFGRYGAEVAMGSITKEQFDYWYDNENFEEYMSNLGFDMEDANKDIPKEAQFEREFYEFEDIGHMNGPEYADSQYIIISEVDKNGNALEDENGNYVEDETVDMSEFVKRGAKITCGAEHHTGSDSCKDKYFMFGQYFNKGGWTAEESIKTGPDGFDFKKLEITYENFDGFKVFSDFIYDGTDYYLQEDSTGKSSSFYVDCGDEIET
jgi:hypothetical protein|tara:strand:+ start:715 stop:1410 length:696 start_codon:yes stop_codon:yes gene_type:complete